jgi:uncharacterized protein YdeI (BOF family)
MSIKTKTTTVAALAALAIPSAALAHDGDKGKHRGHDSDKAGQAESRGGHGKHHGWSKGRGFLLAGVDVTALNVTDGKLTAPITIDPIAANRKARTLLQLTKEKLKGEDTVAVGTAADAVKVKYHGLTAADALLATDIVKIQGKVDRKTGALDITKIHVVRRSTADQAKS